MQSGSVAIMPPGALGVSFFTHLTGQFQHREGTFFVGMNGSRSIGALLSSELQIARGDSIERLSPDGLIFPTLSEAWERGHRPEILIACPNPDQLLQVVSTFVGLIERIWEETPADEERQIPSLILSSNGIYFQRVRQMFVEKLEESILLGRLPDLWPDHMPAIVGHLLRGVTFQTGVRSGSGAATVYRPGPSGISTLAGGSEQVRARCCELLAGRGGWFENSAGISPTRLEFEKAIANLTANLLGLLYAFGADGIFARLTIGEIIASRHEDDIRELVQRVFEVGRAIKVFTPSDSFEGIFEHVLKSLRRVGPHVPSSLQSVELQLEAGTLEAKFPPTETWLIDPLIRYARSAQLSEAVTYFEGLRAALTAKLEQAVGTPSEASKEGRAPVVALPFVPAATRPSAIWHSERRNFL